MGIGNNCGGGSSEDCIYLSCLFKKKCMGEWDVVLEKWEDQCDLTVLIGRPDE